MYRSIRFILMTDIGRLWRGRVRERLEQTLRP